MNKDQKYLMNSGSYIFTTDISQIDLADWANFVSSNPDGNIFQTPGMSELYIGIKGHKPVSLFCIDKAGHIAGMINAVVMSGGKLLPGCLTSRAIVTGGPLIREGSEEIAGEMMKTLARILPHEVIYLQVRNIFDTERISNGVISAGFRMEEHLNYLVDLTAGSKEVWRLMHPTRRKQIRRAEKRGVSTIIHDQPDKETLDKCYNILEKVYRRIKLPLARIDLFYDAFKRWSDKGNLMIITAHCDGTMIGFRFFFVFGGRIYDWYAGSEQEFNDRYPNDILPWKIMEWGIDNGCTLFDFGGAGNPGEEYGVRDYKKNLEGWR